MSTDTAYDLGQSQTTAPSLSTPEPTSSATSSSSNSATQDALGLAAGAPAQGTDLASTLSVMGETGSVVLDAMPVAQSVPLALTLVAIDWVREWLAGLDVQEVASEAAASLSSVVDLFCPPGSYFEFDVSATLKAVAAEVEPGSTLKVVRTKAGFDVTSCSKVTGGIGEEKAGEVIEGAGDAAFGIGGTAAIEGGPSLTTGWSFSFAELFGVVGDLAVATAVASASLYDAVVAAIATAAPSTLTVGSEVEAKVGVTDSLSEGPLDTAADVASLPLDFTTFFDRVQGSLTGTLTTNSGMKDGKAYACVKGEAAAEGAVQETKGEAKTWVQLEAFGSLGTVADTALADFASLITSVTVTTGTGTDKDAGTEARTFATLADALAALAGLVVPSAEDPVGDLRVNHDHQLASPEKAEKVVGERATSPVEANLFIADAELQHKATMEVLVAEDDAREAAGTPVADAEALRDVQRAIAAERFGQTYEAPIPYDFDVNELPLSVANYTVEGSLEVAAGATEAVAGVKGGGTAKVGIATALDRTLDPASTQLLLSA